MASIEDRIGQFLVSGLEWDGDPADLVGTAPLRLPEVVDSEGLLELVSFLEDEYGIEIDDEEITPNNFETVSAVARMVSTKSRSAQSTGAAP